MFVKSGREETTYLEGEKIPSIRYHILKDSGFVKDGFSTRRGGVSKGQFSSMNFSVKMGDNEENVQENFRIFLAEHGFKNPVMADQVHGKTIRLVSREDVGKNVFLPKDYSGVDGLITNEPGVTLVTTFADCVPLYLVDPVNHAIAANTSPGFVPYVSFIFPRVSAPILCIVPLQPECASPIA